jgi:hypothetical protein
MQNIKVEVKVTLASGASVGLTDGQNTKINSFITDLLFGQAEKVKRNYVRRKGTKRHWTPEEDELLIPVLSMRTRGEVQKYYKKIKPQLRRTSTALSNRVYTLRQANAAQSIKVPVTTWQ